MVKALCLLVNRYDRKRETKEVRVSDPQKTQKTMHCHRVVRLPVIESVRSRSASFDRLKYVFLISRINLWIHIVEAVIKLI